METTHTKCLMVITCKQERVRSYMNPGKTYLQASAGMKRQEDHDDTDSFVDISSFVESFKEFRTVFVQELFASESMMDLGVEC